MIVTAEYTVKIAIYWDDYHRYRRAVTYLERHGWKETCGGVGTSRFKGEDFRHVDLFKKTFDHVKKMCEEMKDIEDSFNDGFFANIDPNTGEESEKESAHKRLVLEICPISSANRKGW